MNRKVKIGLVGILLLSIMIPAAISVSNGEGTGVSNGAVTGGNSVTTPSSQQIQQANDIAIKAVADTSKNTVVVAKSANPIGGGSNGLYVWISPGINDVYNWGSMTYIPLKVEGWDNNGNNINSATVYIYLSYWNTQTNNWQAQSGYPTYQSTGNKGDNARVLWSLPPGKYWYSFIEVYYYDINNVFHYAYQIKYFNT